MVLRPLVPALGRAAALACLLAAPLRPAGSPLPGPGPSDDTAALQRAVDAVGGTGGTLRLPAGIYRVDALKSLRLRSRMTLELAPGAVLKALPNGSPHSAVLLLEDVSEVVVRGGVVEGEREGHTGRGGEWGHGVSLLRVRRVRVEGVTARGCWGDGFYVSGSREVELVRVMADRNRRQGLSVTSVQGLKVLDSTFQGTGGTLPEDGIDLEPNPGETVEGVLIRNCRLLRNAGFGLEIGVPLSYAGRAWIRGVRAEGNLVRGNGAGTLSATPRAGIEASNCEGVALVGNTVTGNGLGILLRNGADGFTVSANTVSGNLGDGILQYRCRGNRIQGNVVTGNAGAGIRSPDSWTGGIEANRLSGNGGGEGRSSGPRRPSGGGLPSPRAK